MPEQMKSIPKTGMRATRAFCVLKKTLPALGFSAIVLAGTLATNISAPAFALPIESGEAISVQNNNKIQEPASMECDRLETADGKKYQMNRVTVNASPEDVFATIIDYKNSGKLFSNLTKSDVLSRDENNKTSNVSFTLKGIMNIWSFDYVLSIKESYPNLIEFRRVSGAFKRNEGYWKLIPLDSGRRTEVVYAKYIESGLPVPPQLVAKQVQESTASVVANLKKVVENPNQKLAAHQR